MLKKVGLVALIVMLTMSVGVFAQGGTDTADVSAYPTKNVNFIIPYNAGGGTDTLMRLLAGAMEEELGKSMIISNKGGGLGQVGLTELSSAKADGYTIGALSNLDHILVLETGENVSYDFDSFEYLGAINTTANVIYANDKNTKFKTMDDLISYAKANPGKLTVAISGKTHIAEVALLEQAAGIDLTCVMQASGNDSLKSIMGGHVDLAVMDKKFVAQVAGMGVTPLATFSSEPVSPIEDLPTLKSLGYDVATETYRVIVAPKGTPTEICKKLEETIKVVSSTDEFKQKMADMGEVYRYLSADEVKARLEDDNATVQNLLVQVPDAFN